jgi:hypothetical protein
MRKMFSPFNFAWAHFLANAPEVEEPQKFAFRRETTAKKSIRALLGDADDCLRTPRDGK